MKLQKTHPQTAMRIPIDRQKKITLLKWLKQGFIDTGEAQMIIGQKQQDIDISRLTPEQRAVLLTIGQEIINDLPNNP